MSFLTVKLFGFFLYASAGAVAASTSASTGASTLAAETAVAATPITAIVTSTTVARIRSFVDTVPDSEFSRHDDIAT